MQVANDDRSDAYFQQSGDTLYKLLRSLEREREPSQEKLEATIAMFLDHHPNIKGALPRFSVFGLLEAIRNASSREKVVVGSYVEDLETAKADMARLSPEDASRSYPLFHLNHPRAVYAYAGLAGLLAGSLTLDAPEIAPVMFLGGLLFGFLVASAAKVVLRNPASEHPQWICALHTDRYLQAYGRGERLDGFAIDQLPHPKIRKKAPFYDLHNQIMHGPEFTFRPELKEPPKLDFGAGS